MASNAALGACIGCSKPFRTKREICAVPETYQKHGTPACLPASAGFHKRLHACRLKTRIIT
eukprot:4006348-Prymnesium_polylepis.1